MGRDHNSQNKVTPATIPTRESVTRTQLETLHSIIQNLSPFILGHRSIFQLSEEDTPRKIDGGAAAAAAVTFTNVCNRIDELLEDKTRWDTSTHDRLYDSIHAVQTAQVELLKAQTEGQRVLSKPSVQLRPTVANDGARFICYYGDITKPGYAIIGMGNTPTEAMLAFDLAFDKAPQEQIILVVEEKPKRKPKTAI